MDLTYRPVLRSESNALLEFLTGNEWPYHAGGRPPPSLVADRLRQGYYDGQAPGLFWVLDAEQRLGLVRLTDLDDDTPMFDVRLRETARGRGVGTGVVSWVTGHVFSTYGHVRRIEATTRQDNIAMRRVLERCGYVKEAHYRDAWPGPTNEVHDAVGYAILRTDWSAGTTRVPERDDDRTSALPTATASSPAGRTDTDLGEVLRREILLLQPEHRRRPDMVLALLHPDFLEYGASGRSWDRTTIAQALVEREPVQVQAEEIMPVPWRTTSSCSPTQRQRAVGRAFAARSGSTMLATAGCCASTREPPRPLGDPHVKSQPRSPLPSRSNMCSNRGMRWDGMSLQSQSVVDRPEDEALLPGQTPAQSTTALPGLPAMAGLVRTVTTPDFAGIRFHEVRARSALNAVPAASAMPFRWTVNPYRGCTHACVYCYARGSHAWLELDTGTGFDREVVVKVNLPEVLARELRRPSWRGEHVALGTNTDPYQRAEGRYRLMPPTIAALARSGTPFSILTKGTLLRRDLPELAAAARDVPVGLAVSLAVWDDDLHRSLEPGTPSPGARLDLVRAVRDLGLPCGVFLAPVLPALTDSVEHLDAALGALAGAGVTGVTVLPLHLRPGAREWYLAWLSRTHPHLVPLYSRLYRRGAYVPADYRSELAARVAPLLARHGLDRQSGGSARSVSDGAAGAGEEGTFPAGSIPPTAPAPGGRGVSSGDRPSPGDVGRQLSLL